MERQELEQIVATVVNRIRSGAAQTTDKAPLQNKNISLEAAKELIAKVEAKAKSMGVNAVIAVSNAGANPVAVHCMDNSYIASYDIAVNKAYTVVALKMPTSKLKGLSQPGEPLYGIQHTNQGRIVIFGGGEPLVVGDDIIGGLGVSGGSEEQDTALAEYGKEVLKEVISWL